MDSYLFSTAFEVRLDLFILGFTFPRLRVARLRRLLVSWENRPLSNPRCATSYGDCDSEAVAGPDNGAALDFGRLELEMIGRTP